MKELIIFLILLAGVCGVKGQANGQYVPMDSAPSRIPLILGPPGSVSQLFEFEFVSTSSSVASGILYIDASNPNLPASSYSSYFEISDIQYIAALFPNPPVFSKGAQVTYDPNYPSAVFVLDQATYDGGVQLSEFAGKQDWALYSGDNFSGPILESGTGYWEPVVAPEPGTFALAGLASVAFIITCRRRPGQGTG